MGYKNLFYFGVWGNFFPECGTAQLKSVEKKLLISYFDNFGQRVILELQLSFQFVASVKVKAYFLEAPMYVSGVTQGQMVGSFIMKKFYPL